MFRVMFVSLVGMWKVRLFKVFYLYLIDVMFNMLYMVLLFLIFLFYFIYFIVVNFVNGVVEVCVVEWEYFEELSNVFWGDIEIGDFFCGVDGLGNGVIKCCFIEVMLCV